MTLEEVEAVLWSVAEVRFPSGLRADDLPPGEKISKLEDHMLACAEGRGYAESARLACHEELRKARAEWDAIEGWEVGVRGAASKATGPQVDAAKAKVRPDLWPSVQKAEWLIRRLAEQIARFKTDEDTTSRLYTIATGS